MEDEATRESYLTRSLNNKIYPRGSKIITPQGLLNIDNGSMGGTHWTFFYEKDNKSFYLDSFGGLPD